MRSGRDMRNRSQVRCKRQDLTPLPTPLPLTLFLDANSLIPKKTKPEGLASSLKTQLQNL